MDALTGADLGIGKDTAIELANSHLEKQIYRLNQLVIRKKSN